MPGKVIQGKIFYVYNQNKVFFKSQAWSTVGLYSLLLVACAYIYLKQVKQLKSGFLK